MKLFPVILLGLAACSAGASRITIHNNSTVQARAIITGDQFGTPAGNSPLGTGFTIDPGKSFDLPMASGAASVQVNQSSQVVGTFPINENQAGHSHTVIWLFGPNGQGIPIFTTYYVDEPPAPLDLDTQLGLFFAGAGFIAPLMVVMLVIRFARKGALSEYS